MIEKIKKIEIPRARQHQIALAFKRGIKGGKNPYENREKIIPDLWTKEAALWHAFEAGRYRAENKITEAATLLRNARFCMRLALKRKNGASN